MFSCITQGCYVLFAQHALKGLSSCNISVSTSHIGNPWSQDLHGHKLIALLKLKRPPGIWISIFSANKSFHHQTLNSPIHLTLHLAHVPIHKQKQTHTQTHTWINTCTDTNTTLLFASTNKLYFFIAIKPWGNYNIFQINNFDKTKYLFI